MIQNSERQSGIEMLKVISIFLIVISHVTQTLISYSTGTDLPDYIIRVGVSTSDLQLLAVNIFCCFGNLGNIMFFACSAWFLVSKSSQNYHKVFKILVDVWIISVLWLLFALLDKETSLSGLDIARSLIPSTVQNNWYMNCYMIFLFVYPILNVVISKVSQLQILRIVMFSGFLWICMNYIFSGYYFCSELVFWSAIYFLIAYVKLYLTDFQRNTKKNIMLTIASAIGFLCLITTTNFLGLKIAFFSNKIAILRNPNNPFFVIICVCLLNIFSNSRMKSNFFNYVSGLSMLIYLISENYLFRKYYRPEIWRWLHETAGYRHIVLLILVYSFVLFILSAVIGIVYRKMFRKITETISYRIYRFSYNTVKRIENKLIKLK